jgi:hypothetical protein
MKHPDLQPQQMQAEDQEPIISLGHSAAESDEFDYDFDYDPNEMYYALQNDL